MLILIDGYNLLHATGIIGRGVGPGDLERSRRALLNFLASALDEKSARRTVVVFDASNSPPGLPRSEKFRGLTVRYASDYDEADTLIEELILRESAPRRLTVVSSDHRIQRAARRRRAVAVDSDRWYSELMQRRRGIGEQEPNDSAKPLILSESEVEAWIKEFGAAESLTEAAFDEDLGPEPNEETRRRDSLAKENDPSSSAADKELPETFNPFPPGYAEDLPDDS